MKRTELKTGPFSARLVLLLAILGGLALFSGACGEPENQIPVISTVSGKPVSVAPGHSSAITCIASDADGDSLSYRWSTTGGGISGTGKVVTWTAPDAAGTYSISVIVNDGKGGTADKSCTITVVAEVAKVTNEPPVIVSVSANRKVIDPKTFTTITCVATDPDGDPITYTWSTKEGEISGTGNVITWTAPPVAGKYPIEVTVSDDRGGTISRTCIATVLGKEETRTRSPVTNESGCIHSDGKVSVSWAAGDNAANSGIRAYFSFDISYLAYVQEVREAKLAFTTLTTGGNPWADLASLCVAPVDYGAGPLQAAAYNLPRSPIGCFDSPPIATIDVTSQLSSLVSDGVSRFQVTVYFTTETDNDSQKDCLAFSTASLTITSVK